VDQERTEDTRKEEVILLGEIAKWLGRYRSPFDCLVAKAKDLPIPPRKFGCFLVAIANIHVKMYGNFLWPLILPQNFEELLVSSERAIQLALLAHFPWRKLPRFPGKICGKFVIF
jgi:hypothetical protein